MGTGPPDLVALLLRRPRHPGDTRTCVLAAPVQRHVPVPSPLPPPTRPRPRPPDDRPQLHASDGVLGTRRVTQSTPPDETTRSCPGPHTSRLRGCVARARPRCTGHCPPTRPTSARDLPGPRRGDLPVAEVSRSGCRARRDCPASNGSTADAALTIAEVHASSRATHGAPRVHAELRLGLGIACGRNRIARLVQAAGAAGLLGPVGRVAPSVDNGLMESFGPRCSTNCWTAGRGPREGNRGTATFQQIETFHDPHRRPSGIGYLSPVEHDALHTAATAAA
ncbi:IS3 family transposase [Kineococcus sp. GCM10028916]|uniref:IS3 family transposase n=1 Tax=Kineococcus sp. GCM10028916 TaxID=3273394 RepID=UPI003627AFC3